MHDTDKTPIGRWVGTVTYEGQTDEYTVEFGDAGEALLDTAVSGGQGTWAASGGGPFSFTIKEVFKRDADGNLPAKVLPGAAYIDIEIEARRRGATYSGTGIARICDAGGAVIHVASVETTARLVPANQQT